VVAINPAFPVSWQFRAAPAANPPPVTLTPPSRVPYPGGVAAGATAIVGPATSQNVPVTIAKPTLGFTDITYGLMATAAAVNWPVIDPAFKLQVAVPGVTTAAPSRVHELASDQKPTPVTEIT